MKQKLAILIVFISCSGFSFSQNLKRVAKYQKDLLNTNISDTARISAYMGLVSEYADNNQDSAFKYVEKAEIFSLSVNNILGHAKALYAKATIYYYQNDYKSAKAF